MSDQLELFDPSTALGAAPCKSTRPTIFDNFIEAQQRLLKFLREQESRQNDPSKGNDNDQ
jgi:hypothetical protein